MDIPKEIDEKDIPLDAFGKAVKAALKYYPFGMNSLSFVENWAYGPTFAVKMEEEHAALYQICGDYLYNPSSGLLTARNETVESLIKMAGSASDLEPVKVAKKGHPQAKVPVTDKHGAVKMTGAGACTARAVEGTDRELAYPLFALARNRKVASWRALPMGSPLGTIGAPVAPSTVAVGGLVGVDTNGDGIIFVMPRKRSGLCEPGKE